MTPLYTIHVRRDAHTMTPVSVPEYEIPLLQEMFGMQNILNQSRSRVDEDGLGESSGNFNMPEDEYSRLTLKYGDELVEAVYGKRITKALENAIAASRTESRESLLEQARSLGLNPHHNTSAANLKVIIAEAKAGKD